MRRQRRGKGLHPCGAGHRLSTPPRGWGTSMRDLMDKKEIKEWLTAQLHDRGYEVDVRCDDWGNFKAINVTVYFMHVYSSVLWSDETFPDQVVRLMTNSFDRTIRALWDEAA